MRNDNQESNLKKFILLENVAAKFKYPCILDLKMGTRQHGDDAPQAKVLSQTQKCATTTSSAVGLRLIGMQVYHTNSGQFVCQNKYYGRKLTVEGLKKGIELFLFDGEKIRTDLVDSILFRLPHLYSVIEKQENFRFYSSSLLIMYGGCDNSCSDQDKCTDKTACDKDVAESDGKLKTDQDVSAKCKCLSGVEGAEMMCDNDNLLDVRMIDFAHSTHQGFKNDELHNGVDKGYMFGLKNLIVIFEDIQKRFSQPPTG